MKTKKEEKRKSYLKHRDAICAKQQQKRAMLIEWAAQFKKQCSVCGEPHPACLDFHHKNKADKEMGIAQFCRTKVVSKEVIEKEISKCIVLCSNCHRKLHWADRNKLAQPDGSLG